MSAPLVTVGWQVEVVTTTGDTKKKTRVGRAYQVKEAAQKLCEMLMARGDDAHVCAVQKFERDKKVIR